MNAGGFAPPPGRHLRLFWREKNILDFWPHQRWTNPPHANDLAFLLNPTASCDCCRLFNTSPPLSQNLGEPRNTLTERCSILTHRKPLCLQVMVQICCTIYLSISSSSPPVLCTGLAWIQAMTMSFTYQNCLVWHHKIWGWLTAMQQSTMRKRGENEGSELRQQ